MRLIPMDPLGLRNQGNDADADTVLPTLVAHQVALLEHRDSGRYDIDHVGVILSVFLARIAYDQPHPTATC